MQFALPYLNLPLFLPRKRAAFPLNESDFRDIQISEFVKLSGPSFYPRLFLSQELEGALTNLVLSWPCLAEVCLLVAFTHCPGSLYVSWMSLYTPLLIAMCIPTYTAVLITSLHNSWGLHKESCPMDVGLQPRTVSSHVSQQHGSVLLGTS